MTTIISFVVVLGVLIFIHELGHFAIAKFAGVGVEKFSLGFGPKIIAVTKGETEYRLSALPLGGYVKMTGESVEDEVSPEDIEKSFTHKPLTSRAAIVVAGPVMNLILAFVLLPVIFMIGVNVPAYLDEKPVVGYVTSEEAAMVAGLKKGDIIESLNGSEVTNWEGLMQTINLSPERELQLKVMRDGSIVDITLIPQPAKSGAGIGGFLPPAPPTIATVSKGYPAEEAGIESGDLITAIDGVEITHWIELQSMVMASSGPMAVTLLRGVQEMTFTLTPRLNEDSGALLIGVTHAEEMVLKRYGFIKAVGHGMKRSVDMTVKLFVIIKGLLIGEYSLKTLGGPIMIAQVAGQAAQTGPAALLTLVAFLSLQLGIINLFPIPVLDGGHLVFFAIELVRGKPLSDRVMGVSQQVGFVMLITLMVLVTWNDIFRLIG